MNIYTTNKSIHIGYIIKKNCYSIFLVISVSVQGFMLHELGQAVRRIMARKDFTSIIVYLDDFLVIVDTQE